MTVRYVDGSAGNNSWDGLAKDFVSGTNGPKLSLNGGEDSTVAAGDLVHVRTVAANGVPIVYRELLTCDVSGTSGNVIEYRADVAGIIWPVGGVCRITGSDNDTTGTRAHCVTGNAKNYRTFTGFTFDLTTDAQINVIGASTNWTVQDCYFPGSSGAFASLLFNGAQTGHIVRRCDFIGARTATIWFFHSATVSDAAHLVENCLMVAGRVTGVLSSRVGGIAVKHCTIINCNNAVHVNTALAGGQTVTVNNCVLAWNSVALTGTVTGEITENYNSLHSNATDRSNTATGANSNSYPLLLNAQLLLDGFQLPNLPMFGLSEWSPLRAIAGTSMSTEDLTGITRPATDSKKSWGAMQFADTSREATTVRTGAASLKLADAATSEPVWIPVTAVSTTVSAYVRWQVDYAGTKPQMILSQAGQSEIVVTATGSSEAWELLSHTWTPAALPSLVALTFRSNNTASGSVAVYVDDIAKAP